MRRWKSHAQFQTTFQKLLSVQTFSSIFPLPFISTLHSFSSTPAPKLHLTPSLIILSALGTFYSYQSRKISPFSPRAKAYSFWSASQLSLDLPNKILSESFIANPYKSQKFIEEALKKGIRKMLINDIE